ncbi:MAG: ATP-binding protein [[Eubacterium] sulci]|nr:ATP-binding protein [[Eubacterium] sulci]
MKKLFSILIENSIKYSSDNSAISIELKSLDGDGSSKHINGEAPLEHFSFSISNYSENLKKGSYDVLFDRFYRLDSSRNSETGGFGIGLSIAKAIVQKHGGEIKAYSPDGERMVFKLEI